MSTQTIEHEKLILERKWFLIQGALTLLCTAIAIFGQGPGRIAGFVAAFLLGAIMATAAYFPQIKESVRHKIWPGAAVMGTVVLVTIGQFLFGWGSSDGDNASSERAVVEMAVENGGSAEVEAYRALPNVELASLKTNFVIDGPAYFKIERLLKRHAIRGWVLHPDSYRKILSFNSVEPTDGSRTSYTVRTTERWYLRWIDKSTQETVYVYDELNDQQYNVAKNDGRWYTHTNDYQATVNHAAPPPIEGT